MNNVENSQLTYISQCPTSQQMWQNLKNIYKLKESGTLTSYLQNFHYFACTGISEAPPTAISEDMDLPTFLNKLKLNWERINLIEPENISPQQFKEIMIRSLPHSWDAFTDPYNRGCISEVVTNPKKLIMPHEFIGLI